MKDLEKMGIAGTKLLHMFITNAKYSRGVSECIVKEHIHNLILFLHWARKNRIKYEIRNLFFGNFEPYRFLDIFILIASPGYSRPDTVKISSDVEYIVNNFSSVDRMWYGVFDYMRKYLPIDRIKGESFFEKNSRIDMLNHRWKNIFILIKSELEYDNTFKLNGGPLEAGQIS
jgi:hypothetical protein